MTPQRTMAGACLGLVVGLTLSLDSTTDFHFAFNNDTANFNFNKARAVQAALRAGDLPFWNGLEGGGIDQWAEGSKDVLLAPLLLFLDAKSYLAVGGFLYLAAAILAFFWFGRLAGWRPWPAAVGAIIWATNGFDLWHLHELNQQSVLCWLPLMLGAIVLLEAQPVRARLILVLAAAGSLLVGRFDFVEYLGVMAVAFILIWCRRGRRFVSLQTLAIGVGLGALAAGVFVVPYLDAIVGSARIGQVREPVTLPWHGLIRHWLPSTETVVASRGYLALIAFPLAALGWRKGGWERRFGFVLILAYGLLAYDTGFFQFMQRLPLHGANWNVERFIVFFFFGMAVLATSGLNSLETAEGRLSSRSAMVVLVVATLWCAGLVAALWRLPSPPAVARTLNAAQIAFTAVLVALFTISSLKGWHRTHRLALALSASAALGFGWGFNRIDRNDGDLDLLDRVTFGRIAGDIVTPAPALRAAAGSEPFRVFSEMPVHPAYWAGLGIESFGAYTPFTARDQVQYTASLTTGGGLEVPADRTGESALARVGNVRFVCTYRNDLPVAWREVFQQTSLRCFERPDRLPRVRLVRHVRTLAPGQDALAAIAAYGRDDPSWLESGVVVDRPIQLAMPGSGDGRERIVSIRRNTNGIDVQVESRAGTVLTIAERLAPGWRATIGGTPVELFRANGLFQAVVVPPGTQSVALRYRPPMLTAGSIASLVGLVLAFVWIRGGVRR